jgi:hypothetical protein
MNQSNISFVDECCGLQSVVKAFAAKIAFRDLMELVIDNWSQAIEGRPVALAPLD